MTKKQLRHIYKSKRTYLTANEKLGLEARLYENFRRTITLSGNTVHIFLPISRLHEIDTYPLLQEKNVRWVVSKSDFETHEMTHFEYDPTTLLKKNEWDIPEPEDGVRINPLEIDIVITPLLCYDLKGYRVGYGKGFYDRFLVNCRPDVIKIGVCLFEPVERIDDAGEHDIRLTLGITPKNTYYF